MQNNRLAVNCLVQVTSDNRLDFEEWVNYHIALGFDTIFVCDMGRHTWLDEVCAKLKDHVVLAPRDERWHYKSEIIRDYVSRREYEEWCICMDEHDFLWISPARARSIIEYVDLIPRSVAAVTFYVKHMSSKDPMRYRVGTQMDCFTHTRREPEGFFPAYEALPNTGITMFRVCDQNLPLRDPVTPVYANKWVDSEFRQMTPQRFTHETTSQRFYPTAYSVRCYRYAIRSGDEMNFDDKMVPVGFDVQDLSMQKAREMYLHIPVNPETETLFAKTEPPEKSPVISASAQIDAAKAEKNMPITRARIDKLIFKGNYFEDIAKYVEEKDPAYDRALLETMFETERRNIVESSHLYTEMQELIDQGKTDDEIRRLLVLTETTYNRMKAALPVLDIKTEYAVEDEAIPASGTVKVNLGIPMPETPVTENVPEIEGVVDEFEKSLDASQPTADELATRNEALEMMDAKSKPKAKKSATKKKASSKKPAKARIVVGSAKQVDETAKKTATQASPVAVDGKSALESELDAIGDSALDDIDMDAVIANAQTSPQET